VDAPEGIYDFVSKLTAAVMRRYFYAAQYPLFCNRLIIYEYNKNRAFLPLLS
jgi:hypothetical protein